MKKKNNKKSATAERRNDRKGSNSGGREGGDTVDRDEENEIEGGEKRGQIERGGERWRGDVAVKDGWRLCKSERLEAHLNSGCVSPALAECYLL